MYTVIRHGRMQIMQLDRDQCKSVGHTLYKYEVKLKMSDRLDDRGFSVDHDLIHQASMSIEVATSCETIAMRFAIDLGKTLNKLEIDWRKMKIKIQPILPAGDPFVSAIKFTVKRSALWKLKRTVSK